MGIENFKKLYIIVLKLVNTGDKMGHKNNWGDRMSILFGLFPMLMNLSSIKWGEIGPEMKDFDESERIEIVQVTIDELDLQDDNIEEAVEKSISMTNKIVGMVNEVIELVNSIKKLFKK